MAQGGIFRLVKGEWVKGAGSPTGVSMMAVLADGTVVSFSGTFGSAMCTIYRSADHGATWTKGRTVNRGIGQVFQKAPSGDLWVGAEASGPYRSTDGGVTWNSVENKGAVNGATFVFPKDGSVIYAANAVLYRWTAATPRFVSLAPGGAQAAPGLPWNRQIFASVTASDGTIYAGTGWAHSNDRSYVYVSTDNGQSFALAPWAGLPNTHRVNILELDSTGVLYAGLRDGGLWRTSAPVASVGPFRPAGTDASAAAAGAELPAQTQPAPAAAPFVKPTAEEALAFLRTLPRGWGERGPGGSVLTWVQPWEKRTVQDIKTMRTLHPGYHIRYPRELEAGRPVAPEAKCLPQFAGRLHLRLPADDYRYFTAFERLEKFEVTHDLEDLTDECLFYLGHLSQSVTTIRLEMCEATGEGIRHLQNLKDLKTLTLNLSRTITDVALVHAAGIASLERLEVSACPAITGTGVAALARLKNLKALKTGSCSLSDASLANFRALAIEELDLSHTEMGWAIEYRGGSHANFTVTVAGLRALLADRRNLPNLKRLILTDPNIRPSLLTPSTFKVSPKDRNDLARLRPGLEVR